jgi:EmrB/QacA subfamily drug resistance transporter
MLAGSTADRIGRRKVFQIGLVVFSLGSLLCALAPTLNLLIAARVLQAIGGSMLNPVAMSIIRNVFEDPRERAQAIGVWGGMIGLSMALGPLVGGALVDSVGWRSVFLVNVPVGVLALTLTALYVPESRAPHPRRLDPVGQGLVIVALSSLTYAIIEGGRVGFTSPAIIGLFCLSLVSFAFLVFYELRRSEPLLEMRFFKSVPFAGASAIAVCAFACQGGFLFLNTLYLQEVRGLSPFEAGLYVLPMAAMTLVFSPLSGRIVGHYGSRAPLLVAGIALTIASVMLTQITPDSSTTYVLGAYFVFGFGFGFVNPPITDTAVSGMPPSQAGVAAAVASTSRQVGNTLGVAIVGAVAGAGLSGEIGKGFAAATHASWWIIAGLSFAILVLGLATTTKWARQTAVETANRFREGGTGPAPVPRREPVPG